MTSAPRFISAKTAAVPPAGVVAAATVTGGAAGGGGGGGGGGGPPEVAPEIFADLLAAYCPTGTPYLDVKGRLARKVRQTYFGVP